MDDDRTLGDCDDIGIRVGNALRKVVGDTVGFRLGVIIGMAVGVLLGKNEGIMLGVVVGTAPVNSIPFPLDELPSGDVAVSMRL